MESTKDGAALALAGERDVGPGSLAWVPITENLQEAGMGSTEATMVREWRFAVQKAFLGRGRARLHDTDMAAFDALFAEIEAYEMSVLHLEYSKIGKVMRYVGALPDGAVPRDAVFGFRGRAMGMAERWRRVLDRARRVREVEVEEDYVAGRGAVGRGKDGWEGSGGVMPGSLGGSGGAAVGCADSNEAPTSVLDWVQSQIREGQSGEPLRVDYGRGVGDLVVTMPVGVDEELSVLTVREWRDTLERGFLSKGRASGEEMPALHSLLTTIEAHQRAGKLRLSHITSSGIGKAVNHIALLPGGGVPRDGEFGFRERARVLVGLWRGMLDRAGLDGGREMPVDDESGGLLRQGEGGLRYGDYGERTGEDVNAFTGLGEEDNTKNSGLLSQNGGLNPTTPEENATEPYIAELINALHIDPGAEPSTQPLQEQDQEFPHEDWKLVEPEPETPRRYENRKPLPDLDDEGGVDEDWEIVQP